MNSKNPNSKIPSPANLTHPNSKTTINHRNQPITPPDNLNHPSSPTTSHQSKNHLTSDQSHFISILQQTFPEFHFKTGKKFTFRPPKTIILGPPQPNFALLSLHELGHALCKHKDYKTHIERLKIESEAWQMAKTVCTNHPELNVTYDEDFAQSALDTYRDWLHQKSECKTCHLTRFQTPDGQYHCPKCDLLA